MWEIKLPDGGDAEALEALEAAGLGSAAAIPAVPSILPLPLMEGPTDPSERVDAICASLHRLAPFKPSGVVCLTGPGDDRDTVVEGLRTIGEEAERAGVRVGLEPINRVGGEDWTMITPLGGRRAARRRRPSCARDPVRQLAPLEHADVARGHRA